MHLWICVLCIQPTQNDAIRVCGSILEYPWLYMYVYVHGIYTHGSPNGVRPRTHLLPEYLSTVVYVAYPWVTQWCTAHTPSPRVPIAP